MRRAILLLLLLQACGQQWHSDLNYDQIRERVQGKNEAEVITLLGRPDVYFVDPWVGIHELIWHHYTYLDGQQYPVALRRIPINVKIIFDRKDDSGKPDRYAKEGYGRPDYFVMWPYGVSYTFNKKDQKRCQ